jgi:hypothetical protein
MPIKVKKEGGGLYSAIVTPPHGSGRPWTSPNPLSFYELSEELRKQGCHPVDIIDAFSEADPGLFYHQPRTDTATEPIKIQKRDGLYSATISKPDNSSWNSPKPIPFQELFLELRRMGYHPSDVLEAFAKADPSLVRPKGKRTPPTRP